MLLVVVVVISSQTLRLITGILITKYRFTGTIKSITGKRVAYYYCNLNKEFTG